MLKFVSCLLFGWDLLKLAVVYISIIRLIAGFKKPHHHCCVPFCVNDSRYDLSLSFHCFPGDPETRKIWIQKIRRDPGKFFSITTYSKVCSAHFTKDHITVTQARKRMLKSGKLPTKFNRPI